jgi:tRNA G10  N-methylase Trm11
LLGSSGIRSYLYTYACHEDEIPLCRLELRTLLDMEPHPGYVESSIAINPSRSPFIKFRLSILLEGDSLTDLVNQVKELNWQGSTFKVVFAACDNDTDYEEQRLIERQIGLHLNGKADMRNPAHWFGVTMVDNRWLFGDLEKSEAVWLHHQAKPQNYSTALSTRVARAVANIAVPVPQGIKAVDPCCGMGTVLIEALSMGIDIVGFDINPLAVRGARTNLAHFGMPNVVTLGDMRTLDGYYDVLILDMPYNLCSVLPEEEQFQMFEAARRLAAKVIVITTETMDSAIMQAGFIVVDRCVVRKGKFERHILVGVPLKGKSNQ